MGALKTGSAGRVLLVFNSVNPGRIRGSRRYSSFGATLRSEFL
jgi:hypothetical protein